MQEISSNTFIPPHPLKTAVLFLVFNRPDTTRQVFEAIRKAEPPRLYIAADGPRVEKAGEAEKCEQARRIATQVDWECEVKTLFREKNLGCRVAVSSAIDWFFENEEEGIILEDDCLPSQSFFWFCEELLERYRDDRRIMMISGDNFQFGRKRTLYSYYFSRYPHIWGWALWRRAWEKYDVNMNLWPEIREGGWLYDYLEDGSLVKFWHRNFDWTYNDKIDTWDHQFTFACMIHRGLCILPNDNLVSNIGFGLDASKTKRISRFSKMKTKLMRFPLKHPPYVIRDIRADRYTERGQYTRPLFFNRLRSFIKASIHGL